MTLEQALMAVESEVRRQFGKHGMLEDLVQEGRLFVLREHGYGGDIVRRAVRHCRNYLKHPGVREETVGYLRHKLARRNASVVLSVRVNPAIEQAVLKYQRKRRLSMSDALREVILRGLRDDEAWAEKAVPPFVKFAAKVLPPRGVSE